MTKKVIAIISVLKPADDTRMYEKFARSVSNTNKYEINIIGFSTKNIPPSKNIHFHPLPKFKRSSLKRCFAWWRVLKILLEVKPKIVIATTPELLIVSIANKILFGSKIIYDIQENYYLNIRYSGVYPALIKNPLAVAVRCLEILSAPWIDHYILAEKVYQDQLHFIGKNYTLIENKADILPVYLSPIPAEDNSIRLLYCGTISLHYGVFDAIDTVILAHEKNRAIQLFIVGYAAHQQTLERLKIKIQPYSFIHLIGGDQPIPHHVILQEMQQADFCLLPYQPNKSTQGRLPTKLFECLVMKKPMIITSNPAWNQIIDTYRAGIFCDFTLNDLSWVHHLKDIFYTTSPTEQFAWKSEVGTLNNIIDSLT